MVENLKGLEVGKKVSVSGSKYEVRKILIKPDDAKCCQGFEIINPDGTKHDLEVGTKVTLDARQSVVGTGLLQEGGGLKDIITFEMVARKEGFESVEAMGASDNVVIVEA